MSFRERAEVVEAVARAPLAVEARDLLEGAARAPWWAAEAAVEEAILPAKRAEEVGCLRNWIRWAKGLELRLAEAE